MSSRRIYAAVLIGFALVVLAACSGGGNSTAPTTGQVTVKGASS